MLSILKNGGLVANYRMLDFVREIRIQPTEKNLRAGCLHTYTHTYSQEVEADNTGFVFILSFFLLRSHTCGES